MAIRAGAEVFCQFRILGGALDEALATGGCDFPLDENGKPTFQPPAGWYIEQFSVRNAVPPAPRRLH